MPLTEFPFNLDRLLEEISDCNRVLVYGGMDTGKTTLVKTLFKRLGGKVLDSDLGQPEIGPPGLISLGTYDQGMEEAYFVGDFTPRGNLVQVMTGVSLLANRASSSCLIDTDGWVKGEAARVYKGEMINLIGPDRLLLLQEEDELEQFTTFLSEEKIIRLDSRYSGSKSPGDRATNRQRKLNRYFYRLAESKHPWERIRVAGTLLGRGEELPSEGLKERLPGNVLAAWQKDNGLTLISDQPIEFGPDNLRNIDVNEIESYSQKELRYRLVGCYQDLSFRGMGTITGISGDGLEILGPDEGFETIKLGKKRVKPDGRTLPD